MEEYRVKLPIFEGPLALLLHLVRINECDIMDIPVALIVRQYLEYLDLMREMNLDVAGDYLVMSATLMKIKSALLLPRPEEESEEFEDPRKELVRLLLEYEKFRDAAHEIEGRARLGRDVFARKFPSPEVARAKEDSSYLDVSLFELMDAFREILKKVPRDLVHVVVPDRYSVREKMTWITELLAGKKKVSFESLFDEGAEKDEIIITFLALLELMRRALIIVYQERRFSPIHIMPRVLAAEDTKEDAGES